MSKLLARLFHNAELLPFSPLRSRHAQNHAYLPQWMQLECRHYLDYASGWSKATGLPMTYYAYGLPRKLDEHDGEFADVCF